MRNLEREISNLARKSVRKIESGEEKTISITPDNLKDYSGIRKHRFGETENQDQIGVVTGLAWTEVGGDLLTIEAVRMPGKGQMKVTGNLRDVMKESISAANSFVQSRAPSVGSSRRFSGQRISTCTCRKGRRPRMVRLRVSA